MDSKLVIFFVAVLTAVVHQVLADIYFDRTPKAEDLEALNLKCVPGRTVISVEEKKEIVVDKENSEDDDMRRTHMNFNTKEEYCKVCVCSVEGHNEYCSRRPATNVNECIRIAKLKGVFQRYEPYDHVRTLSYRIRRDYIWHKDEIPYRSDAKCARGVSYYTNDDNIKDTTIDIDSDIESLLEYANKTVCLFCVCGVDGVNVTCINRDPWFCDYYRTIQKKDAARERYERLFKQDRPAYFRQLSFRLRRTMDQGIYEFLDNGGDALCCDHPYGHRRSFHNHVINKIRQTLKRKVPKENLLAGSPGGDYVDFVVNNDKLGSGLDGASCVPYVSEYSDCNEANQCLGCTRCTCSEDSKWLCRKVSECVDQEARYTPVDDNTLDAVLNDLNSETRNKDSIQSQTLSPPRSNEDLIIGLDDDFAKKIELLVSRNKRSIKASETDAKNGTIKFYNTRDEINEDTLKNLNTSGTIEAKKVVIPASLLQSRRSGVNTNLTSDSPLHISYNQQLVRHITDNKIDSTAQHQEKDYNLSEIFGETTNYTQKEKDKDVSKIVVNELKKGKEVIGDKDAPVMSNITFTPENDTLTAMAFIAGNLLNKLWSMEKDSSGESLETEAMKHEKISDLLELFKEPLTIRQESFLKGALEKLSDAIDKNKDIGNVTLCHDMKEAQKILKDVSDVSWEVSEIKEPHKSIRKNTENEGDKRKEEIEKKATQEAIGKINHVLKLIKKYEGINKNLQVEKNKGKSGFKENLLKPISKTRENLPTESLTRIDHESGNLFSNILQKVTKLLLPNKSSKKLIKKVNNQHFFSNNDDEIRKEIKKMFNIDLVNVTLTSKDKLVVDYLNRIKSNPKLLLEDISNHEPSTGTVEGDVLLNLSQFFKIKSMVDLIKLLEPEKPKIVSTTVVTDNPIENRLALERTTTVYRSIEEVTETFDKLANTKEKLKKHLKTILDDLLELQKESGINTKESKLRIADALPCIYNILKSDIGTRKNTVKTNAKKKLLNIIGSFHKELKSVSETRRFDGRITEDRPKSAVVWERVVNNFNEVKKQQGRRNYDVKPKTFRELGKMLELVESMVDNSYKKVALSSEVNASDRLVLIKALEKDVKQYVEVLKNIKRTLEITESMSSDERKKMDDFADSVNLNNRLSKNILKSLDKPKNLKAYESTVTFNANKLISKHMEEMQLPKIRPSKDKNVKLTRTAIINQLIRNRVTMYLRLKESNGNMKDDPNYDIAKNILSNLERGNNRLAVELYKVFVTSKKSNINGNNIRPATATTGLRDSDLRHSILKKKPLIEFEEPKMNSQNSQTGLMTQEELIKQLLAMNNIMRL